MIKDLTERGCVIKFLSLGIENFGCVKKGLFTMTDGDFVPQKITGVYGQNGSGKSTLVRSLGFLRLLLCGNGINDAGTYFRSGEKEASLKAEFTIDTGSSKKLFSYSVKLMLLNKPDSWMVDKESVIISDINNLKNKASFIYNSAEQVAIVMPAATRNVLGNFIENKSELAKGINSQVFLLMEKERSKFYKTSYIFEEQLLTVYDNYCKQNEESIFDYLIVMNEFAKYYFFVITDNMINDVLAKDNAIPVLFPNQKVYNNGAINYFSLNFSDPTKVTEPIEGAFFNFISHLNKILPSFCPDTKIVAHKSSNMPQGVIAQAGFPVNYYDVFTVKENFEIPLKYESLGIKKIISLVNLMVFVYGNESMFFVVDELDSSINEMILETFISLFRKSGKGQLAFTANNLHSLEILDKNQCCFTSTKAAERFVHLKYVKPNNNLRSLYMSLAKQGGDDKNDNLFNALNEENMKIIFEENLLKKG